VGSSVRPMDVVSQSVDHMIKVHFSSAFTPYLEERDLAVPDNVGSLGGLFAMLVERFPEWGEEVTQDGETPDLDLLIAVNGELSSTLSGLNTPLKADDRVEFHLLLTGG
jgi:molybdopterin converting factor small subunit